MLRSVGEQDRVLLCGAREDGEISAVKDGGVSLDVDLFQACGQAEILAVGEGRMVLLGDLVAESLHIHAGATLFTNGFRMFIKDLLRLDGTIVSSQVTVTKDAIVAHVCEQIREGWGAAFALAIATPLSHLVATYASPNGVIWRLPAFCDPPQASVVRNIPAGPSATVGPAHPAASP
jgi:hypothetical protein